MWDACPTTEDPGRRQPGHRESLYSMKNAALCFEKTFCFETTFRFFYTALQRIIRNMYIKGMLKISKISQRF